MQKVKAPWKIHGAFCCACSVARSTALGILSEAKNLSDGLLCQQRLILRVAGKVFGRKRTLRFHLEMMLASER